MRLFMHIRDGDTLIEDPEGSEFPNLAAAQQEAFVAAREILANALLSNQVIDGQEFEITDEHGVIVMRVPLRSAMRTA
ncbi:DUF6894 family protein [Methylobacterium thuringiense]|uniref:DUF6894 domain-containing protein n=1 Tax=Methylobacterium thuringiense TaxID=1003091 RepID=A0ABQ4TQJ4_9HYPH|nr:hypothetical protein [Methylobacterium thuringiense]GJE56942.1 hypothetical protein EKPJFOCH_3452 [Methylobacterium thuringiense]